MGDDMLLKLAVRQYKAELALAAGSEMFLEWSINGCSNEESSALAREMMLSIREALSVLESKP